MKAFDKVEGALLKRALGYESREITEEYVESDGEEKLSKRKVTIKKVPPDIAALKLYLENAGAKTGNPAELTDCELKKEKKRLLELLARGDQAKGKGGTQKDIKENR